jgi:hypothetical protein
LYLAQKKLIYFSTSAVNFFEFFFPSLLSLANKNLQIMVKAQTENKQFSIFEKLFSLISLLFRVSRNEELEKAFYETKLNCRLNPTREWHFFWVRNEMTKQKLFQTPLS